MEMMNDFFQSVDLTRNKVGSVCTDGAPSMLGKNSGFTSLVKNLNPEITSSHCILHRYALAAKTLPDNFKQVLDVTVEAVNFIRSRALNHRILRHYVTN